MAVKGFNIGGSINRYDFNSLVNKEGAVTADMLGSDVTTQLTTMSSNISTLQSQVATLNDGYTQLAANVFQHHKTITGTITMGANSSGQAGFSVGIDWSVAFAVVRQQDASKLVFLSMGYVDSNNCYVNWRSERTSQSSIPIRIDIFGY